MTKLIKKSLQEPKIKLSIKDRIVDISICMVIFAD